MNYTVNSDSIRSRSLEKPIRVAHPPAKRCADRKTGTVPPALSNEWTTVRRNNRIGHPVPQTIIMDCLNLQFAPTCASSRRNASEVSFSLRSCSCSSVHCETSCGRSTPCTSAEVCHHVPVRSHFHQKLWLTSGLNGGIIYAKISIVRKLYANHR